MQNVTTKHIPSIVMYNHVLITVSMLANFIVSVLMPNKYEPLNFMCDMERYFEHLFYKGNAFKVMLKDFSL